MRGIWLGQIPTKMSLVIYLTVFNPWCYGHILACTLCYYLPQQMHRKLHRKRKRQIWNPISQQRHQINWGEKMPWHHPQTWKMIIFYFGQGRDLTGCRVRSHCRSPPLSLCPSPRVSWHCQRETGCNSRMLRSSAQRKEEINQDLTKTQKSFFPFLCMYVCIR